MEIAEEEEENRVKRESGLPEVSLSGEAPSVTGLAAADDQIPQQLGNISQHSETLEVSDFPLPPKADQALTDEPRRSLQSSRPGLYESYSTYGYGSNGKPKVKLGPRPSLDVGGRPHTSGNAQYRPVAALPAGMKLHSKSSKKDKSRPKSQIAEETPGMTLSPPVPDISDQAAHGIPIRPHTSGGTSANSMSMIKPLISPTPSMKGSSVSPEKARLMKALELRKKQMNRSADDQALSTPGDGFLSPTSTSFEKTAHENSSVADAVNQLPTSNELDSTEHVSEENSKTNASTMPNDITIGEDSGVAFDAHSALRTDGSDLTRSDSYPISPVGASEKAESTKASSISESTDVTVQEMDIQADEKDDSSIEPFSNVDRDSEHTPKQGITLTLEEFGSSTTTPETADDLPLLQPVTYNPVAPVSTVGSETQPRNTALNAAGDDLRPPAEPSEPLEWKVPKSKFSTQNLKDVAVSGSLDVPRSKFNTQHVLDQDTPLPTKQDVPISKFNTGEFKEASVLEQERPQSQVDDSPSLVPSNAPEELLSTNHLLVEPAQPSPASSTFSVDNRSATDDTAEKPRPKLRKRRAFVEPIRTDMDTVNTNFANSEANSLDDDLMDELQSAVVQEAKPVAVSKSPISPDVPSPEKTPSGVINRLSRAFSSQSYETPSSSQLLSPPDIPQSGQSRSVSASAAYLNRINEQHAKPMAKKVNLGSGISQRIKALEKLSSASDATATQGATTTAPKSTAFFSVGKGSIRASSKSPSVIERANSFSNTISPTPPSRDGSPETARIRERSPSIRSRLDAFSSPPSPAAQHKPRPESVSVTARIIRDPNQPFPQRPETGKDRSNFGPLNLKESPLEINHQRAVTSTSHDVEEEHLSRTSTKSEEMKKRRSSITIVRDFIEDRRTSFSERRRSMTGDGSVSSPSVLLSPSQPPSAHGRPSSISRFSIGSRDAQLSPPSSSLSTSPTEEKPEKKSNRASRMLRRMSSSLSSGRKTITHALSPTVREESEPVNGPESQYHSPSQPTQKSVSPITINVGDVNVQFPDNLLWKRRSMILDSQGYLILSPALTSTDKGHVGGMRRYHLGEFKLPIIPDVEMQEMPNSVVLDFVEGSGLQIACEDRAGQLNVLKGRSFLHLRALNFLLTDT